MFGREPLNEGSCACPPDFRTATSRYEPHHSAAECRASVARGRSTTSETVRLMALEPAWARGLAHAVAVHDLIVAGDRMLGRVSPQHAEAREAVAVAIDAALADGVPEATIDAAIAAARADAHIFPKNDEGRPARDRRSPASPRPSRERREARPVGTVAAPLPRLLDRRLGHTIREPNGRRQHRPQNRHMGARPHPRCKPVRDRESGGRRGRQRHQPRRGNARPGRVRVPAAMATENLNGSGEMNFSPPRTAPPSGGSALQLPLPNSPARCAQHDAPGGTNEDE